jgi:signal transduction histidine kinase
LGAHGSTDPPRLEMRYKDRMEARSVRVRGRERAALETLWEHLPISVVAVDTAGNVVRTNRVAEGLLPAIGPLAEQGPLARALASGETIRREHVEFELPDASRRVYAVTAAPIREGSSVVGAVAVLEDLTDVQIRERVAREFVTNAAHQLQTPLAAITSAIQVLQAGAKERAEDRDRFLEHVENATNRLTRLTRSLLVLARAQGQLEEARAEVIELAPLLEAIRHDFPHADVDVVCPPIAVLGNRALLEQVIASLVENALKYAGGRVTITAKRTDDRATVTVADDGPGIPAADRSRVFDRFYRATEAGDGFGLGLAIVREAAVVLGAELALDSDEDGTRVSITLRGARLRPQ